MHMQYCGCGRTTDQVGESLPVWEVLDQFLDASQSSGNQEHLEGLKSSLFELEVTKSDDFKDIFKVSRFV